MKLNQVIKNLREEKHLTQEQLANKAGLTRGYISRLEAGDYTEGSPALRTLQRIAEGLSMPLELILQRADITKDDYMKNSSVEFVLRAKTDLTEEQITKVKQYIEKIRNKR